MASLFLLVESSELLQEDDVTVIVNNPDVTIGGSSSSSESVEGVDTIGPVNVITPSIDQSNPSQTSGNYFVYFALIININWCWCIFQLSSDLIFVIELTS